MKKNVVALLALGFVTISPISQATIRQTGCTLTEATAPSVRGLKLGMSAQQLLGLFPGVAKKKEMKDVIERAKSATSADPVVLGFDPAADGDAKQFAGVESVSAELYKAKVVDFSVQYGGATWTSVDEWIGKLSEAFKLPAAREWTSGTGETPNKVLRCNDIVIEASIQGGSASIRIRNPVYMREMEERMKAADEKRRQQVKP